MALKPHNESDQCLSETRMSFKHRRLRLNLESILNLKKKTDSGRLDLSSFKTASRINCMRSLPALLQHIPSWYLESACNVMGSVWSLQYWLTCCTVYCDKSALTPNPLRQVPAAPLPRQTPQNKHILYQLQGLCSNISLNGMPSRSNLHVFAL